MLSIVVYGRNDNYGYNLHKRAAISLNCMAEVLNNPEDEIVFVDFNTADDLPTFPEAIRDTLTDKARGLLRIIRVRGHVHKRAIKDSCLFVNEPLARNIGIRRTNPSNRWILSTNTDMVFVSRQGSTLSEVVAKLEDGYYALPRFEVPETLWETVDRLLPTAIISSFREWGERLNLNEVVTGRPYQGYDAPGDFQLFPRHEFMNMQGFDESMIYGWHVDSNLCKRMNLYYGKTDSLAESYLGYHCDHTRVSTPAHAAGHQENDWRANCDAVETPFLPAQAEDWGGASEYFEEIRLSEGDMVYEKNLQAILAGKVLTPPDVAYTDQSYNSNVFYTTRHAFPYLADTLVSMPKGLKTAYAGTNTELLDMLGAFILRMEFTNPVSFHAELLASENMGNALPGTSCDAAGTRQLMDADLFIVDMYFNPAKSIENEHGFRVLEFSPEVLKACISRMTLLLNLALREHRSQRLGRDPRKFIFVGLHGTIFEDLVMRLFGLTAVPFSCHISHGFVRKDAEVEDVLAMLEFLDTLGPENWVLLDSLVREMCGKPRHPLSFTNVFDILNHIMRSKEDLSAWALGNPGRTKSDPFLIMIMLYSLLGRFTNAGAVHSQLFMQPFHSLDYQSQLREEEE